MHRRVSKEILTTGLNEPEETPEECFKREALGEGCIKGECKLISDINVEHSENPLWKENSSYHKIGFQVFYKMKIAGPRAGLFIKKREINS